MNLTKRLEAVEAAVAKQCGDLDTKFIWRNDGETESEAQERAGLTDWKGEIMCFSWIDTQL